MFDLENQSESAEINHRERRRLLLIIGGTSAVVLGLLIVLFAGRQESSQSDIEGIVRAGSLEYDAYRAKVQLEMVETIVHPNLIGMAQHEVRARLVNDGERTLTAIEVTGRMLGLDDSTIAKSTAYPIPRANQLPLPPGQSLSFSIKIDRPGSIGEELVKDHSLELTGLRFQ
jgi:hypothetical protein